MKIKVPVLEHLNNAYYFVFNELETPTLLSVYFHPVTKTGYYLLDISVEKLKRNQHLINLKATGTAEDSATQIHVIIKYFLALNCNSKIIMVNVFDAEIDIGRALKSAIESLINGVHVKRLLFSEAAAHKLKKPNGLVLVFSINKHLGTTANNIIPANDINIKIYMKLKNTLIGTKRAFRKELWGGGLINEPLKQLRACRQQLDSFLIELHSNREILIMPGKNLPVTFYCQRVRAANGLVEGLK
jgi:hypothetical protein